MTEISITIKLLQGDLIPLEVPVPLLTSDLYTRVRHALPEDIRPDHEYQIRLLREGDTQEEPLMDQNYPLLDGECLCALLDPSVYRLTLDYIGPAYEILLGQPIHYNKWRLTIMRNHQDIFYSVVFYIRPSDDPLHYRLYRQDMLHVQPADHFHHDEIIRVTPHAMLLPPLQMDDLLTDVNGIHDPLYCLLYNELQSESTRWNVTTYDYNPYPDEEDYLIYHE